MLMVGKVQFGYIYGIGAVGVMGMWTLERFISCIIAYSIITCIKRVIVELDGPKRSSCGSDSKCTWLLYPSNRYFIRCEYSY